MEKPRQLTGGQEPLPRLIALAGFMGTGKTSVGRRVSQRLGWSFVDTDLMIEKREGRSVAEIFAQHGEPYFRAREREAVAEAVAMRDVVVATGGGAIVDEANLAALRSAGLCICLTASVEAILARTRGDKRPLLEGADRETKVRSLLEARAEAYARVPHHIDTTDLRVSAVVDRVLALYAASASSHEGNG